MQCRQAELAIFYTALACQLAHLPIHLYIVLVMIMLLWCITGTSTMGSTQWLVRSTAHRRLMLTTSPLLRQQTPTMTHCCSMATVMLTGLPSWLGNSPDHHQHKLTVFSKGMCTLSTFRTCARAESRPRVWCISSLLQWETWSEAGKSEMVLVWGQKNKANSTFSYGMQRLGNCFFSVMCSVEQSGPPWWKDIFLCNQANNSVALIVQYINMDAHGFVVCIT